MEVIKCNGTIHAGKDKKAPLPKPAAPVVSEESTAREDRKRSRPESDEVPAASLEENGEHLDHIVASFPWGKRIRKFLKKVCLSFSRFYLCFVNFFIFLIPFFLLFLKSNRSMEDKQVFLICNLPLWANLLTLYRPRRNKHFGTK